MANYNGVYIGVDGVARKAKSIYVGVPTETGSELGSLDEGSVVYVNENGSPVEFYVACHNYESGLNGEGRTLLVRKESYPESKVWDSSNKNAYAISTMDAWLNGEYKSLLDVGVQNAIGTTRFYYTVGNGDIDVETLDRSVFLLSIAELGRSNSNANAEGSKLPIADTLKIAYQNGSEYPQWTRTPYKSHYTKAFDFNAYGTLANNDCNVAYGARPCFTLPDTFTVLQNGQVTEEPITMKPLARKVVRAFVGIDDIARLVFDTGVVIEPDDPDTGGDTGSGGDSGDSGGSSGGSDSGSIWDMTLYQYDETILSRMPIKYRSYVQYCWDNFYSGNYANIAVWEFEDWIAVSFLMDDFRITSYNPATTEMKAVGWITCGYHKPTGVWTHHDYRTQGSTGGNYISHVMVSSLRFEYNGEVIYPLREPVAYLYEGLKAPKIPVVEGFDFAAMHRTVTDDDSTVISRANLYLSTMPLIFGYAPNGMTTALKASTSGSVIRYEINMTNGETDWTMVTEKTYSENAMVATSASASVGWANYYVYKTDGSVYRSPSDPIPVYE